MQVTGSNSNQHILSIRFSADGFYFALLNPKAKEKSDSSIHHLYKVDELLSFTANLKHAIDELEWLNYQYKAVSIVIATSRFTLVPLDFFEDEQVETIFYHNFHHVDNELVEFNILQKSNVVVLYGIDKALLTLLYKQFPEAQVKAQATSLIERLTLQNYHVNQKQLLCVIGRDNITIAAMEHHNIICCNSFNCHHITDRLYYILYSWKQLGMNQLSDELLLADNISEADELKHELGHYISNIICISPCFDIETAV